MAAEVILCILKVFNVSPAAMCMSASKTEQDQDFSGSWFRASAMTTMNKNQPDAQ
jgi:hypothetical protein